MGKEHDNWGENSHVDGDENGIWMEGTGEPESDGLLFLDETQGDGVLFLNEAHEALNKLYQKTNKRGRLMRTPKRAESWQ